MANLMISAGDLAYMRETVTGLLPDSCNIATETMTPDGQGGFTSSWIDVSEGVACRLDDKVAASNTLIPVGGGLKERHQYQLTLAYSTEIHAGDKVTIGSATYNVVSVNEHQSWHVVRRAILEME